MTASVLLALLGVLLWCASCANTVTPRQVKSQVASWDGTNQNSGFIGFDAAGNGIITPHARDRYNALVDVFGKQFQPPVNRDDGVTATATNTYVIDPQHLDYFMRMNRWRLAPH